ncbi:MAG: hypothetical protein Pars2KO_23710 [Parasphingorhabdus sp.]
MQNLNKRMRIAPVQRRSSETIERLLASTAKLLEEVGFDNITTNMICRHAGVTPPSLYRYFPDKYGVMEALGLQLVNAQDGALEKWATADIKQLRKPENMFEMLRAQYLITRDFPGGKWIARAMHASPNLAQIRIQSSDKIVAMWVHLQLDATPGLDIEMVAKKYLLATEMGYSAIEMLLDRPEIDVDETLREVSELVAYILKDLPIE